jgi:hypothetical protein
LKRTDRARINAGIDAAAWTALAETLAPSELWSLPLGVVEARARRVRPNGSG